ncbi:SFH5 [Candida theae]|uniref:Phosphatidylinositol transfer protein SFH5 n=1 Tax=Candida theae TaxID=1198502 RepID=A0AAD5BID2_9ASCO|nr:SFH5 [Candida theae]KAI5965467.1 SFH5 [Candida theae]
MSEVESKPSEVIDVNGQDSTVPHTTTTTEKDTTKSSKDVHAHEDVKTSIKSTALTTERAKTLSKLIDTLPQILCKLDNPDYDEIFGYRINTSDKPHVNVNIRNEILLKFLAADNYDLQLSTQRLIKCFNWRNKFQPLHAAFKEEFDPELNSLGVITDFAEANANLHVITWNLYGNLKNPKKIFEKFGDGGSHSHSHGNNVNDGDDDDDDDDVEFPGSQFLRWRVGLMEKSLQLVDFTSKDNNKIGQIHDYNNVSIFRIDRGMKQATKEIIAIFGQNYPELLSTKFFINVPLIMGWVFTFFKTIRVINEDTLKKFQVSNHGNLSEFLPKSELPKSYGGSGSQESNGKKSSGDKGGDLFSLDVSNSIKLTEYGECVLKQKANDHAIKHINDEVE